MTRNMVRVTSLMACMLFGVFDQHASAQLSVRYVNLVATGAGGANTGISWADAYTNLWVAMSTETSPREFWVARGVYSPTNLNQAVRATIQGDVLYGGFAGTETASSQRDWKVNPTIISGDVNNDGFSDIVPDTTLPGVNDAIERPLFITAAIPGAQLDGFTLQFGNNVGTHSRHGGALYVANTDMTIRNCIFRNNTSSRGGAIAIRGSIPATSCRIENTLFYDNVCASNNLVPGGAIYTSQSTATSLELINCTFASNSIATRPDGRSSANGLAGADLVLPSLLTGGVRIRNCIFWSTTNSIQEGLAPDLTYSNVRRNSGVHAGVGNINATPHFVSEGDHDYRISQSDPGVDAGDSVGVAAWDLDHEARIQGASVDMGAYEAPDDGVTTTTTTTSTTTSTSTTALPPVTPSVVYVRRDATGADNGTSWADAYDDLHQALTATPAGAEFWVAAGMYTNATPATALILDNGDAIYGGFAGNETLRMQRDWGNSPTTISGDHNGDAIPDMNGSTPLMTSVANSAASCTVDGFTFRYGSRTATGGYGGAIAKGNPGGAFQIRHCVFRENRARYGGAVGVASNGSGAGASNIIENCLFINNVATTAGYGGAIYQRRGLNLLIGNCTFHGNAAGGSADDVYRHVSAAMTIQNSILWSSPNPLTAGTQVAFSDVRQAAGVFPGVANLNADPLFLDAAGGDYRLQASSPALDAATATAAPADDLAGVARPQGAGFDMGAYEQLPDGGITTTTTTTTTSSTTTSTTTTTTTGVELFVAEHATADLSGTGTIDVHSTFAYPEGARLLSLRWTLALPPGVTLVGASGDGAPQIQGNEILLVGSLQANPIVFTYTLQLPDGNLEGPVVRAVAEYMATGMVDPANVPVLPDPLPLHELRTLIVESKHAVVSPAPGTYELPAGSDVFCSANVPVVSTGLGERDICRGWTGEGSAPASGTGTNVMFTLSTDSRVSWQWQPQYLLELESSVRAGHLSAGSGWRDAGTQEVVTATPNTYWTFRGWAGDTNGCDLNGNVITVPMDQARAIAARYRIDTNFIALAQAAPDYYSPSTALVVACEFRYPEHESLALLNYVAVLPEGWVITAVSGDAEPQLLGPGLVEFTGALHANPLSFSCVVHVPGNQPVTNTLMSSMYFQLASMAQPEFANADALIRSRYHSADYQADLWQVDGQEVNRVLAYWRAGGYAVQAGSLDGYAPAEAPDSATGDYGWHSADYAEPRGVIGALEAARVLAYWNAGGYHVEPAGLDGYAPGAPLDGEGGVSASAAESPASAEQQGPAWYDPAGVVVLTNVMTYDGELLALCFRPVLPEGWTVESVSGAGAPELYQGEVLWTQGVPPSPVTLVTVLRAPIWERAPREMKVEWLYFGARAANAETALPAALTLEISPADLDGDGLHDGWERHFAGDLAGLSGERDDDGDGLANFGEWVAGTDPTDPTSALRIDSLAMGENGMLRMSWTSVPDRHYIVWQSTSLTSKVQPNVAANVPATAPRNSTSTAPQGGRVGFYWLEVQ